MADKIRKYKAAMSFLSTKLDRTPTDEEMADYLKLSVAKVRKIESINNIRGRLVLKQRLRMIYVWVIIFGINLVIHRKNRQRMIS